MSIPFPTPVYPQAAPGPLSDGHLAELAAGKRASKRIRRTAAFARASSMTTGVLAAITMLGILFGDWTSLVLGAALLTVAVREGKFGARLALFEPGMPRALAMNQLILGLVVVVYALVQVRTAMHVSAASVDPQVDAIMADFGAMVKSITIGFYLCVAVGGAAGGGLMALYYSRRTRTLSRFLAETPPWVLQAMRAAG
ncbi:MAG: hypothetical protein H7210_10415 [Pyrinomonadaceae bacterium]|nr:hypothetical protein [Phycisphaerales bacterium]